MGFHVDFFGRLGLWALNFLLLAGFSHQNVHVGVDLVTRLSNNWVPMLIKEVSLKEENVVASPYGLMSNLAMILEATSDEKTREEIFDAVNMTSEEVAGMRKGFKAYCGLFLKYSNDPEAAGSFNSVSMKSSFKLNASYKEVLEKYYCANITETRHKGDESKMGDTLEFSSIAGVMSHWKDYDKLPVYTFLSHRPTAPFKRRDGSTSIVPMIPQVGVFKAGRWENSKVVLIPLQAKLVDLLFIMPDEAENVDGVARKLTEFTIPLLVQSLRKEEIEMFIPQTAVVNKNFDLRPALVRRGIGRIFEGNRANLTGAASTVDNGQPIRFIKLEQNAFFSTSFVAVNSVAGISSASGTRRRRKRDAKTLYIDHPFLFFILQRDTQLVVLAGKIENPLQVPL